MAESPVLNEYNRPAGWRFAFEGINLRDVPDTFKPTKFASAKNIRAASAQAVQTRPGYTLLYSTGGTPLTDLSAYAAISSDDLPSYLARNVGNQIYDDTGTLITTLQGAAGYGVWMLPFRPSESPQTWMYVASIEDYQKISSPPQPGTISGPFTTLAYKVGIAEPQTAVNAALASTGYLTITGAAGAWTAGGTLSALANANRSVDTAGSVFVDPLAPPRFYTQVSPSVQFGIGEIIAVAGPTANVLVEDVFAAAPSMVVRAIRYGTGSTGSCTVSVGQIPTASDNLGNLRRNSIVQFSNGEKCIVIAVETGADGSIAFETSTVGTIVVGNTVVGVPSITLIAVAVAAGNSLTGPAISASCGTGIGTAQQPLLTSPFAFNSGVGTPQSEDYIHISLKVSDPTQLAEIELQFSVGVVGGAPDFTTNYYYTAVQPSLLAGVANQSTTALNAQLSALTQTTLDSGIPDLSLPTQTDSGANQWTEILVPISSLLRVGGDETKTLEDCNGVRLVFNALAPITVQFGAIWVGHQGQPDVGPDGAEYKYVIVPRNSVTGVVGNASPAMRYGLRARRQQIGVTLLSAAYDPQIDTWDVYRYGGSVTSYRYIGSAPSTATLFTDNYGDEAVRAGGLLENDNFEPWPSIDVPFLLDSGGPLAITAVGPRVIVTGGTGAWPATIDRWLPGTLIELGGQNAFTLRSRPVQLSASSYSFEVEECVSPYITIPYLRVLEPKVAKNPNPYIFGPDAAGTFFGVGDALRPGTVSYSKASAPDSVPDKYNQDLCPPSEPLMGGVVKAGVSVVASTQRWWALYPSFGQKARYTAIEQPVGRGLIAPYAIVTDGVLVWFWARDGICVTAGGPFESLTDTDLYPLFPHEGVDGTNITRFGLTYYAPDYSRAATFRLRKAKTYLFADYQDSTGTPRTLVMDIRTRGWSQDVYNDSITIHYAQEMQTGPLKVLGTTYTQMIMGDAIGRVWKEIDCINDFGTLIGCHIATFEWDGGDQRMQPLWGDQYLDCVPKSQLLVTPTSLGANAAPGTVVPVSTSRQFVPISVLGGELNKFMGMLVEWAE